MPVPLSEERRSALLKLLDDDSTVVRQALLEELGRTGAEGVEFLRSLCDGGNRLLAGHAREFLELMGQHDTLAGFSRFIESFQYELETGCLLLDRTVDPDLDTGAVCSFIDAMAARCREIMVLPSTPLERCRVLNRVIFHEFGFRGDMESFYDPDNSFLSRVIARRKGIPLTLSILYLLVGQRCNLNLWNRWECRGDSWSGVLTVWSHFMLMHMNTVTSGRRMMSSVLSCATSAAWSAGLCTPLR